MKMRLMMFMTCFIMSCSSAGNSGGTIKAESASEAKKSPAKTYNLHCVSSYEFKQTTWKELPPLEVPSIDQPLFDKEIKNFSGLEEGVIKHHDEKAGLSASVIVNFDGSVKLRVSRNGVAFGEAAGFNSVEFVAISHTTNDEGNAFEGLHRFSCTLK